MGAPLPRKAGVADLSVRSFSQMGKFYIINAPWAFSTVWSLVKGWLDEATVAKIHILGSDYQKQLLEQIPSDSLPKFLGGSCDSCHEGCSMSDAGPWKGKTLEDVKKELAQNDASQETTAVESNGNGAGETIPGLEKLSLGAGENTGTVSTPAQA